MNPKTKYFLEILKLAEKKYGKSTKRLASDNWKFDWQTLITTVLSAQTRDETTIPVSENLFKKYPSLEKLSKAKYEDVLKIISRVNFKNNKSRHVVDAAKYLINNFEGKVPNEIDKLIEIPGVGRKTANLVISVVHSKEGLCVDTHVHRISNVFGFVNTNTPEQSEMALKKLVPKKYWSKINRLFVLWGQDVRGYDRDKFLAKLEEK